MMKTNLTCCLPVLLLLPTLVLSSSPQSLAKTTPGRESSCELQREGEFYSPEQLKTIAQRITVRVMGDNTGGSGTLIAQEGGSYLVLTSGDVISGITPAALRIQTHDGRVHQGRALYNYKLADQQQLDKINLVILEFTPNRKYCLTKQILNTAIKQDTAVMASGYSVNSSKIIFSPGTIKQIVSQPTFVQGYEIGYDSATQQGMSGGPIINSTGDLIGIHGKSAFPILNNGYVYADGKKPLVSEIKEFRKLSWGIPVGSILAQLKPEILARYGLPVPRRNRSVPEMPILPEWLSNIESKVREFTVRIDGDGNNGSGVIIAREGNTYTVLTSAHVLCKIPHKTSNNHCVTKNHTLVTASGQKYPLDNSGIKLVQGVDIATVKFNSGENYPVATLANYAVENHQYVFTVGEPKLGQTPRLTVGQIFSKENGLLALKSAGQELKDIDYTTIEDANLGKEYELVYTSVSQRGMSGGPVVDSQGRVICIHGKAEGQVVMEETTEDGGVDDRVQLGYNLGIPISTFLRIAPQLNTRPERVENTPAPQLKSWEIESIRKTIVLVNASMGKASAIEWIERGNQLWLLGRYQEAVTAFENAIERKPAFIHLAYYGKGLSLESNGNDTEATGAFEQAVKAKFDFSVAWNRLAALNIKFGRLSMALAAINQAIKLQSMDTSLYSQKFYILLSLTMYQEAIQVMDQAILLNPHHGFYINRGAARRELGDYKGAIDDYTQAIEISPELASVYYERGGARRELGDYKGAIDDYTQAIKIEPESAFLAYYERGGARRELGDYKGAIDDYTQAIEISPEFASAYYDRGGVRRKLRDYKGAIDDYTQTIKIEPESAFLAYYERGGARRELGDYKGAIDDYTQAIEISPEFASAYYERGFARRELGDENGAGFDFQRASDLQVSRPRILPKD
ncbi:tetratricopeptide repeat protein [Cylindrospermopsis curvispora]|uniref:Tetratricopeptide repeat protein n=1 Tax=Cylindrospermopsis curvispora GIHE-G1 TaxID=2666332 RepID=A0A7H0EZG2_9CYAN|nr:tetratricopeptide repeat protein [Cylindrospermopsis curvispora]QNP29178.1 tetratricopeptide repeat protein [Cylindrospermopsis curvispora GIHE-G1]